MWKKSGLPRVYPSAHAQFGLVAYLSPGALQLKRFRGKPNIDTGGEFRFYGCFDGSQVSY